MFVYASHQHQIVLENFTIHNLKLFSLVIIKELPYNDEFLHGPLSTGERFCKNLFELIFASLRLPKKIFEFNLLRIEMLVSI